MRMAVNFIVTTVIQILALALGCGLHRGCGPVVSAAHVAHGGMCLAAPTRCLASGRSLGSFIQACPLGALLLVYKAVILGGLWASAIGVWP